MSLTWVKGGTNFGHMANRSDLSFKDISRIVSKRRIQRYPNFACNVKNGRVMAVRHMSGLRVKIFFKKFLDIVWQNANRYEHVIKKQF